MSKGIFEDRQYKNSMWLSKCSLKIAILAAAMALVGCDEKDEEETLNELVCGSGEKLNENGKCECDNSKNYYGEHNKCQLCEGEHKAVNNNQCGCDAFSKDDGNGSCVAVKCEGGDQIYSCVCNDKDYCNFEETGTCVLLSKKMYAVEGGSCVCMEGYDGIDDHGECVVYGCVEGQVWGGSECICDESNNYYGNPESCERCEGEHRIVNNNQCVCESGYIENEEGICIDAGTSGNCHDQESGGECVCDNESGYYGESGNCQHCEGEHKVVKDNACVCADGFETVVNADQSITCVSPASCHYTEKRTEDGGCICDESAGFYGEMGKCEVCTGEHVSWKDGACVCDIASGYYGSPGNCRQCGTEHTVLSNNICVCDSVSGYYGNPPECLECKGTGAVVKDGACICDTDNGYYGNPALGCSKCEGEHMVVVGDACVYEVGYTVHPISGEFVCDVTKGYIDDKSKPGKCQCNTEQGFVKDSKTGLCVCENPKYKPKASGSIDEWPYEYYVCDSTEDYNENNMKDSEETASDQGKDCRDKSVRHSCSDFCDSNLDYHCSTRCTLDSQCISDDYFCRSDGRCAPKFFEVEWVIENDSTTIEFPGGVGTGCNYVIDWGQGYHDDTFTDCAGTSSSRAYREHLYPKKGTYHIRVSGVIKGWTCGKDTYFCNNRNSYLKSVISFGPVELGPKAFYGASKLESLPESDIPNGNMTDMTSMFGEAENLNQSLNHWDTSNVEKMVEVFDGAKRFNGSVGDWDTSKVTSMSSLFSEAISFNQPLNNWDTSKVTSMAGVFDRANRFNQPLDAWDTSSVTNMQNMFYGAENFNQPLNTWNVSKVTEMSYMFNGALMFNQPLNSWDVSNVIEMSFMFGDASSFNQLLDNWNVSKVKHMDYMFSKATSFNKSVNRWNTSSLLSTSGMFYSASGFNQPLDRLNTSNVTHMDYMFSQASSFNQPLNDWDTSSVGNMQSMFNKASSFNQPLEKWNIHKVIQNSEDQEYVSTEGLPYDAMFEKSGLSRANWTTMKTQNEDWGKVSSTKAGLPADYDN